MLHNPLATLTPSQMKERSRARARAARIAAAAAPVRRPLPPPMAAIVEQEPVIELRERSPDEDWVRRQLERHPVVPFKEPWFSIEEDITDGPVRPRIDDIIRRVAQRFLVRRGDLLSARRTADIALPRHIVMYLAKTMTLKSYPEIGRRLGNRDHTTVLHGVRRIETLLGKDEAVTAAVVDLKKMLGAA